MPRGYLEPLLDSALERTKSLDRTILFIPTDPDPILDQKDLILVLTYNPANPDVIGPIRKYWPILDQARGLTPLHNLNTIVACRRPPNLRIKRFEPKSKRFPKETCHKFMAKFKKPL